MMNLFNKLQDMLEKFDVLDFVPPLLLRLYLAPIFYMAGSQKLNSFDDTVSWFGNPDWGLGLPFPWLMAFLVTATEFIGAFMLMFGLGTRWISIPLSITMVVAMLTVHIENGWLAIAAGGGPFASERTIEAIDKLDKAKSILQEHGNYSWLTENGSIVILNNGIEFAATYLVMLLTLFIIGGGKFISLDYWIARKVRA